MTSPIKVAIVGASGYSGEELTRLLLSHPGVDLTAITSRQYAGQTLAQVFAKFSNHPRARALRFTEPKAELLARQAQVVFLALPHGVAAEFAVPLLDFGCQVIDLSADFRLKSASVYKEFYGHDHPAPALLQKSVYGLPELNRAEIKGATLVASPGCYPTSIIMPLAPFAQGGCDQERGDYRRFGQRRDGGGAQIGVGLSFFPSATKACAPMAFPNTATSRRWKSN